MGSFRRAWVLAAVLMLNIVLAILLTPLGFESRPPATLRPAGYLAIGAVFAGLALDLAALALIFLRRIGWASRLAIAGSVLFLFPNVVDQTGVFFSVPIPPAVRMLEYMFIFVLLVTLLLASTMQRAGDYASG
jgi:hypothetical protein